MRIMSWSWSLLGCCVLGVTSGDIGAFAKGPSPESAPCSTNAPKESAGKSTSIEGAVTDVSTEETCMGMHNVLELKVRSAGANYVVDLGPEHYVKEKGMAIAPGDHVKVSGVLHEVGDQATLVASEVEHRGRKLVLRDAQGRPAWAGSQRGGGPARPAH